MIRILHIVPNMNAGGLETFIMNIYRCLDREKIQFDFLVHYKKHCFYDDEIERMGGHIYRLSVREDNDLFKYKRDLDCFFEEHVEYKIVHGHMASLAGFYMKAAQKHGVEYRIVHSHGDSHEYNVKGWIKYFLFKYAKWYATDRFACSEASGRYLFRGKNFQVIHNPIDCDRFAFNPDVRRNMRQRLRAKDKVVWGCVARFDQQKNHTFLLKVFSEFLKINRNSELWLFGTGPLEKKLRDKAEQLGIKNLVKFMGVRHDIELYYQGMDVFILTSFFEGLAIVTIEAQASGLLTVVSDKISAEAHITENLYALPLNEGSWKWAERIAAMLNGFERKDKHEEVKEKGFDAHTEAEKLITLYKEMAGGGK